MPANPSAPPRGPEDGSGTGRKAGSRPGSVASALLGMLAVAVIAGVMVAVAVTPAIALTGVGASGGIDAFDELPADLRIASLDQKTEVYAKDGDRQVRIASFYAQDREVVGEDGVSGVVKDAAIAGEDVRYYQHGAVDPVGVVRATLGNLAGDDLQGASTITQQYVKNICVQEAENAATKRAVDAAYAVCTDPTVARKLREARLAIALEKRYTKQEILLGYLNIAGFGGRVYGVQAAARYYFGVPAKRLSVAQAASLMAIVNNPEQLRLDDESHSAANRVRRDYILGVELQHRLITRAQHDEAVATPIRTDITPSRSGCPDSGATGFFCDYVRRTVLADPAFGRTEAQRTATLSRSGYRIHTTLDLGLQRQAKDAVDRWVPGTASFDVGGAAVSVEVGTGRILTMAENRTFDEGARKDAARTSVNYAAARPLSASTGFQPGSTFKLFTLLEWLRTGHTLNQVVNGDAGTKPASSFTACGKPYSGIDWDLGNDEEGEGGDQTVLHATAKSVNGAFASMAQQLDLCDIQKLAEDFGVHPGTGVRHPELFLPFVVGTSYTVSPVAMASAYAAIANDGRYCSPVAIDRVTTAEGKAVPVPRSTCRQVVDPQVAIAAAAALRGVMSGDGTAAGDQTPDGVYEFGKTGTTDEAKQVWMIGTSSKVTTAAWVGNVSGNQNLRQTSFPNPCYVSGAGRAADARHCVWKDLQTAVNARYGGATTWAQPAPQYLDGGAPVQDQQQAQQPTSGTVPDVTGRTKFDAAQALVAAGYSWAFGPDEGSGSSDVVASTEPAAGQPAAPHSQVTIHGGG